MQAEESLERGWRIGEYLEKVWHHAKLGFDGVQQLCLFGVGGFAIDYIDTTHDLTPESWVSGLLAVPTAAQVKRL
jgi:hypothetical protein